MRGILFFCFAICFIQINNACAQTAYQLPPNQPEQDACNALQLCGTSFFTPYSYTGIGRNLDIDSTPCLPQSGGGERNSMWLKVHVSTAGNLVFQIKPVDPNDNYDFAIINATGKVCGSITQKDVVRCNYNNDFPGSNIAGIVGLIDTSRTPFVPDGTKGYSYCQPVFAKADDVYLILINNLGNYVTGAASKGFTIDFRGSTCSFYGASAPQLSNINAPCNNANRIIIKTTAPVLCNTIAPDGSDFIANTPVPITGASGLNCTDHGGYTSAVIINFASPLPPGSYTIGVKNGNDNNTLSGLCGDQIPLASAPLPFIIKPGSKEVIANEAICFQQLPYTWNGKQISSGGDSVATYTVASSEGCDSTTILNLHVLSVPQQITSSARVCDGDSYALPWDSIVNTAGTYVHHFTNSNGCDSLVETVLLSVFIPNNGDVQARDSTIETGFCEHGSILLNPGHDFTNYLWNTGETTPTIIVTIAGSYGLEAKDSYGCTTIDTFVVAAYPRPVANFNSVEHMCIDSSVILDAGDGYVDYLWEDGSTAHTLFTNHPGKYWVRLTNTNNCTATDSVNVVTVPRPSHFLGGSITKCSFKVVSLSPSSDFYHYKWSNGSGTKSTQVSTGGNYWLDVTDINGCIGRDSVTVIDSFCPQFFFIPNAFTPNNDGHNDKFKPKFAGTISGYRFVIYNQWGQLVFSSKDDEEGWDGTINGAAQPNGTYIWMCTYKLNDDPLRTDRGTLTLIR